jgi:hypothetical protein
MARVVMQAAVSVDGYIADPDDTAGPLLDWYGNGDTEVSARTSGWTFHVSQASADYVRPFWDAIKVTVTGRHLFDTTNGWDGHPAAGDELVVVTRRPLPQAWLADHPDVLSAPAGSRAVAQVSAVLLPSPAKIGEVGDCADQVDLRLAARPDAFCSAVQARRSSACDGGLDGRVARVHDESWLRRAVDATTGLVRPENVSV